MLSSGSYEVIFSSYDGHQSHRTRDHVEYTGLFFCKMTYLKYDAPSETFQTAGTNICPTLTHVFGLWQFNLLSKLSLIPLILI